MNKIGKLDRNSFEVESIKISLNDLRPGVNDYNEFIIKYIDGKVVYIIDKICDHAGGRLVLKSGKAICPMHSWILDLDSLTYEGSKNIKKSLDFELIDGMIIIKKHKYELVNNIKPKIKNGKVKIKWLNHATVYIECNGVSIVLDPWLFGPAFLTGWWLAEPSTAESLELLKRCDYIFISHNHPDHCHLETLSIIDKNKTIIVPDYRSKSVYNLLDKAGFNNIENAEFLSIYKIANDFNISILKSGDFRDDAGIYIEANGHEFLFSVDANFLNSYVLPRNIDLFASAFASGASGFPLCYYNYTDVQKLEIIQKTKIIIRNNLTKLCKDLQPKYFLPYAGMFKEKSVRDEYIKFNNSKNTIDDYIKIFQKLDTNLIIPNKSCEYEFRNGNLKIKSGSTQMLLEEDVKMYVNKYKETYVWDEGIIVDYFKKCDYTDKQILYIIPTDDDFNFFTEKKVFYINFLTKDIGTVSLDEIEQEVIGFRVMKIYIRSEIFMAVIINMLPWEDFLIGFQCRIYRTPNIYEDNFWYHFTNEYISKENFRYSPLCGSCSIVEQNPIWINN